MNKRISVAVVIITIAVVAGWLAVSKKTVPISAVEKPNPANLIFKPGGSTPNVKDPELPMTERQKLVDRLFTAAQSVVNRTGDHEARRVLAFLKENAIPAEPFGVDDPTDQPVRISDGERNQHFFTLVPLVASDAKLGGAWTASIKRHEKENTFASFQPNTRMMIVPMDQEVGQMMTGVSFLHEGYHAMNYLPTPHDWQDHKTFCRDERDAHMFENRLLAKLGGPLYTRFVATEAKKSLVRLRTEGKLGQSVPSIKKYPNFIYQIFDLPKSEVGKDLLSTSIWVAIVFHTIDLYADKAMAEEEKARFLYSVYCQSDSLPKLP